MCVRVCVLGGGGGGAGGCYKEAFWRLLFCLLWKFCTLIGTRGTSRQRRVCCAHAFVTAQLLWITQHTWCPCLSQHASLATLYSTNGTSSILMICKKFLDPKKSSNPRLSACKSTVPTQPRLMTETCLIFYVFKSMQNKYAWNLERTSLGLSF